jgi:hypothetical protein
MKNNKNNILLKANKCNIIDIYMLVISFFNTMWFGLQFLTPIAMAMSLIGEENRTTHR